RTWVPLAVVGLVAWVAITLLLAAKLPGFRPEPGEKPWGPISRWIASGKLPVFRPKAFEGPVPSLPWTSWLPGVVAGVWDLARRVRPAIRPAGDVDGRARAGADASGLGADALPRGPGGGPGPGGGRVPRRAALAGVADRDRGGQPDRQLR